MKKYKVISPKLQIELNNKFGNLIDSYRNDCIDKLEVLSISSFDHWLSEAESFELLQNVSINEQKRRYELHLQFCASLINATEVLSVKFLGRSKRIIKFRKFFTEKQLLSYLAPEFNEFGDYSFMVLLPKFQILFVGGFDSTNHFYGSSEAAGFQSIKKLVNEASLHVLPSS